MRLFKIVLICGICFLATSVFAQENWTPKNIRVSCAELHQLEARLLLVTNKSQFFNNRSKTWKDGCSIDSPNITFYSDYITARSAGVSEKDAQKLGHIGWLVSDKWIVPVEAIVMKNGFTAYRPANVYSHEEAFVIRSCRVKNNHDKKPMFVLQHCVVVIRNDQSTLRPYREEYFIDQDTYP